MSKKAFLAVLSLLLECSSSQVKSNVCDFERIMQKVPGLNELVLLLNFASSGDFAFKFQLAL